jgi:hypothetical protein
VRRRIAAPITSVSVPEFCFMTDSHYPLLTEYEDCSHIANMRDAHILGDGK